MNLIVQAVLTDLEVRISDKKGTITVEPLPIIHGSPILLNQLFYNLVNNALKFSKPEVPPKITISSRHIEKTSENDLSYVEIAVRDNGIGFEQSYAESIFNNFVRLNPRTQFEGTGLGLSLCKKVVQRHDGKIWAEGRLGEGATFFVQLPC